MSALCSKVKKDYNSNVFFNDFPSKSVFFSSERVGVFFSKIAPLLKSEVKKNDFFKIAREYFLLEDNSTKYLLSKIKFLFKKCLSYDTLPDGIENFSEFYINFFFSKMSNFSELSEDEKTIAIQSLFQALNCVTDPLKIEKPLKNLLRLKKMGSLNLCDKLKVLGCFYFTIKFSEGKAQQGYFSILIDLYEEIVKQIDKGDFDEKVLKKLVANQGFILVALKDSIPHIDNLSSKLECFRKFIELTYKKNIGIDIKKEIVFALTFFLAKPNLKGNQEVSDLKVDAFKALIKLSGADFCEEPTAFIVGVAASLFRHGDFCEIELEKNNELQELFECYFSLFTDLISNRDDFKRDSLEKLLKVLMKFPVIFFQKVNCKVLDLIGRLVEIDKNFTTELCYNLYTFLGFVYDNNSIREVKIKCLNYLVNLSKRESFVSLLRQFNMFDKLVEVYLKEVLKNYKSDDELAVLIISLINNLFGFTPKKEGGCFVENLIDLSCNEKFKNCCSSILTVVLVDVLFSSHKYAHLKSAGIKSLKSLLERNDVFDSLYAIRDILKIAESFVYQFSASYEGSDIGRLSVDIAESLIERIISKKDLTYKDNLRLINMLGGLALKGVIHFNSKVLDVINRVIEAKEELSLGDCFFLYIFLKQTYRRNCINEDNQINMDCLDCLSRVSQRQDFMKFLEDTLDDDSPITGFYDFLEFCFKAGSAIRASDNELRAKVYDLVNYLIGFDLRIFQKMLFNCLVNCIKTQA